MSRLLKCYGTCNEKYTKENLIKHSNKNYCEKCLNQMLKDKKDREILYDTIQKVYNIPYPSGQMLRQIAMFKADRNYTYEGMTKTVCYLVKVMKSTPYKNGGLAFIPHYYDSAIHYYNELDRRQKELKDVNNAEKVVKISQYYTKSARDRILDKRTIKMGDILNDK